MCIVHKLASVEGRRAEQPGYWGTLPSAWDHPEPNYVVSDGIGEFWSVLTTIPIAGTLLLYQGIKYGYGAKVLCIYCLACTMYTLAFAAHLTLQKLIFSTTVVSVMSNALLTFAEFSYVVHRWLESKALRTFVVLAAEVILIGTVATLPYAVNNGGVWTLFTVQSPGVFLATALGFGMASIARTEKERATYRIVCAAGCLLSSAMVLSLIECLVGFEHGFLHSLAGFPWIHVAIHIFEQVGIYLFGVGVAALHTLLLYPSLRPGAELRNVGWLVYLYCPSALGGAAEQPEQAQVLRPADAKASAPGGATVSLAEKPAAGDQGQDGRGRTQEPTLIRRQRVRSPGLTVPKPEKQP